MQEDIIQAYERKLEDFFDNIFNQPYADCKRAMRTQRQEMMYPKRRTRLRVKNVMKFLTLPFKTTKRN
ncbi:hypothetical protein [Helicobacter enhydrae]|uniref:hypothetical protein n=1 Tax=Helicobacter enhydrae TaxID=222136 RepID=UPI001901644F|nr:hypothetical protein [Helicobacter enhydrae]